jgi:hypothetical protein
VRSNMGFFREALWETALQGEPCFGAVSSASWFSQHDGGDGLRRGGTASMLRHRDPYSRPSSSTIQTAAGTRERQEVSELDQVGVNP